jgi:hypothetical protein
MMAFNNLIEERLAGLGNQLLNTLESAGTIPHSTTVGDIREAAICDSIRRFLPPGLDACSGFVTDTNGIITPQLDVILFRREALAPFLLEGNSALVPFETFGLAIEVKSTFKLSHFDQIKAQVDALQNMKYTAFIPSINGESATTAQIPPFVSPQIYILAYDTKVAVKTLKSFVADNPMLLGITVIKRCNIVQGRDETDTKADNLHRLFQFWALLFHMGIQIQNYRRLTDDQELELKGVCSRLRPGLDPKIFLEYVFTPSLEPYLRRPILLD